jgi:hypothetical protein
MKLEPSDVDLAVAAARKSRAHNDRNEARLLLVRLRKNLVACLARYPHLFGQSDTDADFVALRVAFEGSDVQSYIKHQPSSARLLFNRHQPIQWSQEG